MNISLIGWNGKENIGDDAMTTVIINQLRIIFGNNITFKLLADNEKLASYDNSNNENISGLSRYNLLTGIPLLRRFLHKYYYATKISRNSNILIIGGGSLYHNIGTLSKYKDIIKSFHTNSQNGQIGTIGVSLGPFDSIRAEEMTKSILRQLDFIAVRDIRSFELLQKWDIQTPYKYAPDLALLFSKYSKKHTCQPKKERLLTVGISLRHGRTEEYHYQAIKDSIYYLKESGRLGEIKIFNFSELKHDNDELCSKVLLKSLDNTIKTTTVEYSNNPALFFQEIEGCDLMLGMRLHSLILAYSARTPFLSFPYHQKCIDFTEDITDSEFKSAYIIFQKDDLGVIKNKIDNLLNSTDKQFSLHEQILKNTLNNFFWTKIFKGGLPEIDK